MAEFKLGRIRFVWKDAWSTATSYYKDDVVRFGGKIYICVIGHTSAANFFTDLEVVPSKWNLVSDGQTWKGDWTADTGYVYGDVVRYGGRLYIASAVHTSDSTLLENDIANWDLFAEGLDWKGAWAVDTYYKVNDLVKYGGTSYVCNTEHTSAATEALGLENDQAKWDILNQGIEYKQTWAYGTRYKVNDVVQYGAALWVCTTQHTASALFSTDVANWDQFVRGFQFEEDWTPTRIYQPGDIVRYGGNQYIALTNHSESNPFTETTDWQLFTQGIRFAGEWAEDSTQQDYRAGEVVRHGGYTYLCTADNQNQEPPNTSYWERLNQGMRWRGEWIDDAEYLLGDVIRYNDNAYICIQQHISEGDDYSTETETDPGGGAENSRPDLDTSGTYWNIIAVGNETSVLTTKGDLVYYSGSGPARLPVGDEGQVLQVNQNNLPEWAYTGVADDVYYVAPHGRDVPAPTAGRSIDKPWKTIRYAAEQVEKGAKNLNAARLLELNRQFIQREIVEWTGYQIEENTVTNPDVTSKWYQFEYANDKCERDMGFIVDALIWDLTHGGNVKSREAALSYVNVTGNFYPLQQEGQTVDSINYGLEVIQNVLNQTDPSVNYQVTNGDNSTAIVAQYKESGITAETGIYTKAQALVKIITDAITAGVDTNIPARDISNTLIKVATGKYQEVLPIIVPAECCVIGDELRSTNVQPRKSSNGTLTPKGDAIYSLTAIERIEDVIGDIVEGVSVSATTGNTESQSQLYPFGNVDKGNERKAVAQLARLVRRNIDFSLGEKYEAVQTLTLADQMSTPADGYARNLLLANRAFLKEELTAWITENYRSLRYSKTKCKQDVGYIIDAVCYDLTYGGNWQTVNAGEAYYEGATLNIAASEKAATLAAYAELKALMQTVARGITVSPVRNTVETQVGGTTGGSAQATTIGNLVDDIIDIVDNGSGSVAISYPSITGASAALQSDHADIGTQTATIKTNVTNWISANFPNLTYDSAKCQRDVGYLLDAARYDFALGTNFASTVAAYAYRRAPSKKVIGDQKTATLGAYEYLRQQAYAVVSEASAQSGINDTFEIVNDIIFGASNEGNVDQSSDNDVYSAVKQLEMNKEFIVAEGKAYVDEYYKDTVTATTASSDTLTITSTGWLRQNQEIEFTGTAIGGLSTGTTYYVKDIKSSTTFTISATKGGSLVTVTDDTGSMVVQKAYDYDADLCARDIKAIVDAMKWDIVYAADYERDYTSSVSVTYPSNYKSKYAARYYVNAVIGSQEEDMYYLRNGTGLRLQTLDGLQGDLGPVNSFGTSRPTAGAYASLDPGWGPADERVWITARSPYVQNLSTFGFAATGQRIDGALHDGGNDSIVSNDFTQVISDGIGAHILNNGRAELVSVFTYYSHVGYLAENGGRVRATNGNNSYGDFGSVAEGVDADETAVTAVVDNLGQYNATVARTNTDQDSLLNLEFSHAGNNYTEAVFNVFGPGDGEELVADEFRDNGVFQVRILDDAEVGDAGGLGYLTAANTAQSGTASSITLSATDGNLSTAYPGMKLVITGGNAIGQYGIIDTYNSGTKIATIVKESDGSAGFDHMVPGTTIIAPDSSSVYAIEPAISFTAPTRSFTGHSVASAAYSDMIFAETSAEYTGITGTTAGHTGTNASFDITRNGSKYYVSLNSGGDGYTRLETITIAGTSLGGASSTNDLVITISTVNSATGAVVDFDFSGVGRKGRFVALPSSGTTAQISTDGETWTNETLPSPGSGTYNRIANGLINDGSSTYKESYSVAICTGSSVAAYSQDADTWSTSTLPGGLNTASGQYIAFGQVSSSIGRFVVISESDTDIAYSDDGGQNWTLASSALPNSGFTALTYGNGLFVAVRSGTNNAATSEDGITWTSRTLASVKTWTDVTWGNGRFIAINDTDTVANYSLDGITWTASTIGLASGVPARIAYGQGMFTVTSTDTDALTYSEYGLTGSWSNLAVTANTGGYSAIAFGNPDRSPMFAAIGTGTTTNVMKAIIGARTKGRARIASEKIFQVSLLEPGSGYSSAPTMTITDPNNTSEVVTTVRVGKGVLGNPTFIARGTGFTEASAEINGDESNGNADFFQDGNLVAVKRLTSRPVAGSNVEFSGNPGTYYKLVAVVSLLGSNDGSFTGFLQLSPNVSRADAPADGESVELRIRYSQVRLTGHDFLDIGTGNFVETNYPGEPTADPVQANETVESDGGRVFFTSTDQDGNFRVGDLFRIEQATGVATLNADAFNIAGLQELTLGEVTLGGNSASVSEFSTDPFFTANSDSIVPTQRAIKAYIEAQIGGGGASLNVNSVTAGDIFISSDTITTASGGTINITANLNFTGGVLGLPVAYDYFLR